MPPKGPASKPQLLVCYLCGQQFGSSSLKIHIPQCYDKKMKVWNNADPAERGPKPKHPDTVDLSGAGTMTKEEFNNQQFGEFTDNLAQCENCGRKFLPDRLVVHQRSCKPGNSGGGSKPIAGGKPPSSSQGKRPGTGTKSSSSSPPKGPASKPQLLVCYLCGQQFGTSSLGIHIPQCYDKKMKVWNNADPAERGPKPKHPDTVNLSGAGTMTKEEFNNQQFGEFTDNLAQCENCGRKFLPDRLVVHQRSCKPGNSGGGSKPIAGGKPPSSSQGNRPTTGGNGAPKGPASKPQLLVCYLCGQQFGTSSLKIHIPQCYDKKMKVWNNADPAERGPKPKHPDEVDTSAAGTMTKEEFNNQQFSEFTSNMAQCENCGRKFLPDRLVVHQRSCKPGASGGGSKPIAGGKPPSSSQGNRPPTTSGGSGGGLGSKGPSPAKGPAVKPQLLVCYLCGQQFGSSSLKIHIPQCYDKKMKVWNNADPAERGPKPKHPDEVDTSAAGTMTKEEFNNQQFSEFTSNMAQCENCGRKFLPDRLVVHQRSCKPGASGGGSKPVQRPTSTAQNSSSGATTADSSPKPPTKRNPLTKFDPEQQNRDPPSKRKAPTLPPKLRALQRVLFEEGDANHDGKIDIEELTTLAMEVDPEISDGEVQDMMSQLDLNGDGVLDAEEWSRWAGNISQSKANPIRARSQKNTQEADARTCSECGAVEYESSAKFCKDCGTKYPPAPEPGAEAKDAQPSFCTECGEELDVDAKFCSSCGASVNQGDRVGGSGEEVNELVLGKTCPNCGYGNEEGAEACVQCGCDLGGDDEEENTAPSQRQTTEQFRTPTPPSTGGNTGGAGKAWNRTVSQPANHPEEEIEVEDQGPDDRVSCSNCGRKFAPESIAKHEKICTKQKTRKTFDMGKMRAKGTEIAEYRPPKGASASTKEDKPKNHWKAKSSEFRNAMKASRELDKAMKTGGPLPEPTYSENAHYTPCPHCGRKFAPDVAERHIPKCKTTVNKPKPPPKRRR